MTAKRFRNDGEAAPKIAGYAIGRKGKAAQTFPAAQL